MMKKIISLLMALCLCLCMGVSAFAAEICEDGGAGETPVTLTTTNDGIGGAPGASATRMSVTVPTTLPLANDRRRHGSDGHRLPDQSTTPTVRYG